MTKKTRTTDAASLTNSLFQKVALEMQQQGYNVHGQLAKAIRAQCEGIVQTTLAHAVSNADNIGETFSQKRKEYRRDFGGQK